MNRAQANALLNYMNDITVGSMSRDSNLASAIMELMTIAAAKDESEGRCNLILSISGLGGKVELIKFVRALTGSGLKEALDLVNLKGTYRPDGSLELVIARDLDNEDVQIYRRKLMAVSDHRYVTATFSEVV